MPSNIKQKSKPGKKAQYPDLTEKLACLIPSKDLNVKEELGEGQYGVVQMGEWKSPQGELKQVAIKSIKDTEIDGVLRSILQEAQTMQKLSHDNIVKLFGISLPSGDQQQLRLVTEFAQYGSLEDNLKNKNTNVLKVSTLYKFASQVAHGMHYLASQQLIHRDLAARNILLFEHDLVKISDFGLARSLDGEAIKRVSVRTKLAVAWMAPEVLAECVFTTASDVWSYGVTLWEMFSFGRQPWAEFSLNEIMKMAASDPSKRLPKPRCCPDGFYELLMSKCWETYPKDRPSFEFIIKNVLPQLQPVEGTTRVSCKNTMEGYLSYGSKEKVTVILRLGNGMLFAQHEDVSVGLIEEKNVEFPKKVLSKMQISSPFGVKKRESKDVLAELQKTALRENNQISKEEIETILQQTQETQPANSLLDLEVDEVAVDPSYLLYPDPYPAMTGFPDTKGYLPMGAGENMDDKEAKRVSEDVEDDDYMSMQSCISVNAQGWENVAKQGIQACPSERTVRAMPESEYDIIWCTEDTVVLQNTKGSKDDSSIQLSTNGTSLDIKTPPMIPPRLDLTTAEVSPYATSPRRRPVPTPRRKKMKGHRPLSDDLADKFSNEVSRGRSNTHDAVLVDTQNVPSENSHRKLQPKIPNCAEVCVGDENTAINSVREELNKCVVLEKTESSKPEQRARADLTSKSCHFSGSTGSTEKAHCESSIAIQDLIDFSSNCDGCPPLPPKQHGTQPKEIPVYSRPISLPLHQNMPDEVINQPPPLPEKMSSSSSWKPDASNETMELAYTIVPLFNVNSGFSTDHQQPIRMPGFKTLEKNTLVSSPPLPFPEASMLGYQDLPNPVNLESAIPPASKLDNAFLRPANATAQPVSQSATPVSANSEKSYGDEIDAGIQQIQDICGNDVPRDWCYAALLQYQCDVKQVVEFIKVQKLAKFTCKCVEFCTRTLKHCNWDMDRAAGYILEHFQGKDV